MVDNCRVELKWPGRNVLFKERVLPSWDKHIELSICSIDLKLVIARLVDCWLDKHFEHIIEPDFPIVIGDICKEVAIIQRGEEIKGTDDPTTAERGLPL